MKVKACFFGGPHDGAERYIDAPCPLVISLVIDGVLADYHYAGLQDGVAGYSHEPVHAADAPQSHSVAA